MKVKPRAPQARRADYSDDILLDRKTFADVLGMTRSRIGQLIRRGLPVTPDKRLIPLDAGVTWYAATFAELNVAHIERRDSIGKRAVQTRNAHQGRNLVPPPGNYMCFLQGPDYVLRLRGNASVPTGLALLRQMLEVAEAGRWDLLDDAPRADEAGRKRRKGGGKQ